MAKRHDKTQGVVFVLPKSKEFFGRISEDFQKTGAAGQSQKIISERTELVTTASTQRSQNTVHAERELESLKELKDNLSKLVHLHSKLKNMLDELDELVTETNKDED